MDNNIYKIIGMISGLLLSTYIAFLWLTVPSQYFSFGNNSWLMIAADRLLSGQSLVDHIYETNPPLSIIIYIPHVISSWILNTPPPVAGFYTTTIEIILSLLLSTCILKRFDFLSSNQKLMFLISFLISMTFTAGIFITEREHLIFIWLVPYILCQFAITERIKLPKHLLIPTLCIGSMMLLVKPHYGLIPTTLFLIRMIHHRKFLSLTKDIDFVFLSVITVIYLISLFTFFDYGKIILPDVIELYASPNPLSMVLPQIIKYLAISVPIIIFELVLNDIKDRDKRFINLFHICLFLSFIPYFVQMKGFPNHIIPIYGFLVIALSASLIIRVKKLSPKLEAISPALCMALILIPVLQNTPLSTKTLQHKDVEKLEALQYLRKHCDEPCTYFAFHADVEIFNPISAYTGITHGTRYVTFWWLKSIYLKSLEAPLNQSLTQLKNKHANYVIEDFKYYEPSLLIIAKDLPLGNNQNFSFIQYFSEYDEFKDIINTKYKKTDTVTFDFKEYYKGTNFSGIEGGYKYDVYKRVRN